MISYNPKDWITFIFRFHRSDTVRRLFPMIVLISLYSAGVAYLEIEVWKLSEKSHVRNVSVMHTLLGFVISFLLVFRTNTAYERWWEGRKLWGALVNNSRNLAMKLAALLRNEQDEKDFFRAMIPAYASALQRHLRSEDTRVELFDKLPKGTQEKLDHEKHIPNQIAALMYGRILHLAEQGKLSGEHLIFLNPELQSFTDICGACERIRNTPIPYSYSVFIKKFIFFYIMTLPFGYVFTLGYYVVPIVAFIFYVLASLEVIAEEIEEPFGADENDLPLGKISRNIQMHIGELI
ncbi:bestrophin family protein [Haliscomenobacter sp.]|jgi:ion channel-forming bestrophin family protein|uniref:bestrophin family protein n=1 Tax=Haliscomenobacter sp. TaxID=2717303 RepID=UPI003BAA68B4